MEFLDGFHFHTLCEQDSDALEVTVAAVEERFGRWLPKLKWLNLGGGHHITRSDYDRERLIRIIRHLKETYNLEVYLEPGEAVVLNAGFLVATVLDTMYNGINLAILDTSAACHMPDVLEMPYRPPVQESGLPGEKAWPYRLGGPTCLAGDVIGDYSFDWQLEPGSRVVFDGMPLPSIVYRERDGRERLVKKFAYEDFKSRL